MYYLRKMNKSTSPQSTQDYSQVTIIEMEQLEPKVYLLKFRKPFNFIPGQVIGITDDIHVPARMYSIASGSDDPLISILFDVKDSGYLTPNLAALDTGNTIFVTKPYGSFICNNSPAFWIAAGTGIAPFASMFFSGNTNNKTLVHGARNLNSFYFSDNFAPVLNENYIPCCSKESAPNVFPGRVTRYLELQASLPKDINYFICGRAEMVVETRDILISKGISFENIIAEIYF